MMTRPLAAMASLVALAHALPALAQEVEEAEEIIVTGQKPRGSVVGEVKPEIVLNPGDVRSLGVASIGAVVAELAAQTRSGGGGPPVVLLEGRRIGSFAEIRDIPSEAIARVDILPEEVALNYGYRPTQKVINIVLRERFRAFTVELSDTLATAGGRNAVDAQLGFLRIQRRGRINIDLKYQAADRLTEAERGLASPAAGFDQSAFRTLLPATQRLELNAILARNLSDTTTLTLNGELEVSDTTRLNGRPPLVLTGATLFPDVDPLTQRGETIALRGGASANGTLGEGWRWTANAGHDRTQTDTRIATGLDPARAQAFLDAGGAVGSLPADALLQRPQDRAFSVLNDSRANAVLNGRLFALPAGEATTTLSATAQRLAIDSDATRGGVASAARIRRTLGTGQASIDLPIASRRKGVLSALGELGANANVALSSLSDAGTLLTYGAGGYWNPTPGLSINTSWSRAETAATPSQLGDPVVTTRNVPVFDFVTGRSVLVTRVGGGNPVLRSATARQFRVGANWRPITGTDWTIVADYAERRVRDPIGSLPSADAAIAAAFPDRFIRDAAGTLTTIDDRAVNFAGETTAQLRWGMNLSLPIASQRPTPEQIAALRAAFGNRRPGGGGGGAPGAGAPGSGGRGVGGGGGGRGFGGGQGGRVQAAIYHTWRLVDRIDLAPGLPAYDRLNGAATATGGGRPRHEIEVQGGWANNGFGVRLNASWLSATTVNIGTSEPLRFGETTKISARLFADLGRRFDLIAKHKWLIGTRVTVGVDNIFDARQRVTDADGVVPLAFRGAYRDPLGRTVRLSVRKLFF